MRLFFPGCLHGVGARQRGDAARRGEVRGSVLPGRGVGVVVGVGSAAVALGAKSAPRGALSRISGAPWARVGLWRAADRVTLPAPARGARRGAAKRVRPTPLAAPSPHARRPRDSKHATARTLSSAHLTPYCERTGREAHHVAFGTRPRTPACCFLGDGRTAALVATPRQSLAQKLGFLSVNPDNLNRVTKNRCRGTEVGTLKCVTACQGVETSVDRVALFSTLRAAWCTL